MPLFAPFACYFIFELPGTSVESFARLHVKTTIALFLYYTETTRTTYDTRYRYQVFIARSISQQVPRSYCCTKECRSWNRATATISQHVPPLRAQLADVVSTPSERRQHPNKGRARRVQRIVSALY